MNTMLKSLKEQCNCQQESIDEEIDEELGNTTSAYAGGEGPQRTPYAFGGSMAAKKKKFARKSAVYDNPVEETNLWFRKIESAINKLDGVNTDRKLKRNKKNILEKKIRRIVREMEDEQMINAEYGATDPIVELDRKIIKERPDTMEALEDILNDSGLKYSIKKIKYFGYPQGVRVVVKDGAKQKTIPGAGLVYSDIRDWA